jgi:hypothetical protein
VGSVAVRTAADRFGRLTIRKIGDRYNERKRSSSDSVSHVANLSLAAATTVMMMERRRMDVWWNTNERQTETVQSTWTAERMGAGWNWNPTDRGLHWTALDRLCVHCAVVQ